MWAAVESQCVFCSKAQPPLAVPRAALLPPHNEGLLIAMSTIEISTSPTQPPKTASLGPRPVLFSMSKQPVFDFAEPSPELGDLLSNADGRVQGGFAASPVALRG